MANEIKTRILLKYDSYENWKTSEFILKRGEAAVCEMSNTVDTSGDPTILVKYGNDKDKFADLPWTSALAADVYAWAKESGIFIEEGNISGNAENDALQVVTGVHWKTATPSHPHGALVIDYAYIANNPASSNTRANIHNEGILGIDGNSIEEIANKYMPEDGYISGDTFVIKTLILEDKYSYTAYIYNGTIWQAMDGNYNAENIYFDENIVITTAVGNIHLSNGSGEIPAAGKNLKQVFEALWTKEQEPKITLPSVAITTDVAYYEVGSTVVPSYEAFLDPGFYSYGPATGIMAQQWEVKYNNETLTTNSGSFSPIVVTSGDCGNITAIVSYNDGAVPVTNLGNTCINKQIKASSASVTKNLITGYQPNFYGFITNSIDIDNINSNTIRSLNNQLEITTPMSSVKCDTAWMQFLYAVPKDRKTALTIKDSNNLPLTVKSKEIVIDHVDGVSSVYTLFYVNHDAPYGATTLTLSWV